MKIPDSVLLAIDEVGRTSSRVAWAESDTFRVPGDLDYARSEEQQAKDAAIQAVAMAMIEVAVSELHRMRVMLAGNEEMLDYVRSRVAELRNRCRRCGYGRREHQAPDGGGCAGDFAPECDCSRNPRAMADGCPKCKP